MLERFLAVFRGLGGLGLTLSKRADVAAVIASAGPATQLYETAMGDVLTMYGLRKRLQPSTDEWDVASEERILELFAEVSQGFVREI